ncbi:amidophosphoribosyltransferase [Algicola sagamiensis]|uniref:amidophosphoribosyltransferase n=1 Tax=Algicola sagamiensis TaxID=163869 RepID=UPI00036082B7|nr:amidophosphoribosyltransferase [Algicola sagamiensis]
MCGIVGILGKEDVNQALYDSLTVLQHRGQDASGILTIDNSTFRLRKSNGLVRDVFHTRHMQGLKGQVGIGHTRYPTAGTSNCAEAQPFYVNSPFGIGFAHNGNLTNTEELTQYLHHQAKRHVNTSSDSEVLLNILAHELQQFGLLELSPKEIFQAVSNVHRRVRGAYAVVSLVVDHGLLAFRDPNAIRPLVLGKRETEKGMEYMVASESVALDVNGFQLVRDVAPGEAIYITLDGELFTQQCAENPTYSPCIFEYVYFARPDSTLDKISVYDARVNMGVKLGKKIAGEWGEHDIDVVIPVPETSCDIALRIAQELNLPYRQGFVKNRYVGRTFIMAGQSERKKSVRRKLNPIPAEFRGKRVLLVDDSIVRGTTSKQIVELAREAGAEKVYFASAAPEVRFPNVYGIDMPSSSELIAHGRDVDDIAKMLGADGLIYQSLSDLVAAVGASNQDIKHFETSVFDGDYITNDVDQQYLNQLDAKRNDLAKSSQEENSDSLDIHNEDIAS